MNHLEHWREMVRKGPEYSLLLKEAAKVRCTCEPCPFPWRDPQCPRHGDKT